MIYLYKCNNCKKNFDVCKPSSDHRTEEKCSCGEIAQRVFTIPQICIDNTKAEYNHGLGMVINNKRQLQYEVDKRGLIEVGNEVPSKMHANSEKVKEEKFEKRWANALEEI